MIIDDIIIADIIIITNIVVVVIIIIRRRSHFGSSLPRDSASGHEPPLTRDSAPGHEPSDPLAMPPRSPLSKNFTIGTDCTGLHGLALAIEMLGLESYATDAYCSEIDPPTRAVIQHNFTTRMLYNDIPPAIMQRFRK